MRSRLPIAVLSTVVALGLVGCGDKEPPKSNSANFEAKPLAPPGSPGGNTDNPATPKKGAAKPGGGAGVN